MTLFFVNTIFLIFIVQVCVGDIDLSFLRKFLSKYAEDSSEVNLVANDPAAGNGTTNTKNVCDENKLMLHLAKLFIISPERIMLLITGDSLSDLCSDITRLKNRIKSDFKECTPLSAENLYMKLLTGLNIFFENTCSGDSRGKVVEKHQPCLRELHEEYVDCEGPADWFEKANTTILCQIFVDIVDCDYIKTAELCGMEAAFTVRSIALDVFKPILPVQCKMPKSLPKIRDPMPSFADTMKIQWNSLNLYVILFVIYILILF